jgi:hypothetical protein
VTNFGLGWSLQKGALWDSLKFTSTTSILSKVRIHIGNPLNLRVKENFPGIISIPSSTCWPGIDGVANADDPCQTSDFDDVKTTNSKSSGEGGHGGSTVMRF